MTSNTTLSSSLEESTAEPTAHVYRTHSDDERLSTSVVLAVAEALAIDPVDLDTNLYQTLDPDALDRLFAGDIISCSLTFDLEGCSVTVHGDGEIIVRTNR